MSQMSTDELQYLRICGTCHALYETGRPDGMEQRCRCGFRDEERWPRFDYNWRASLCLCCGMEALPSGSRWSPYFCDTCQALAKEVSIRYRRLVFPIGPHSLMHTWLPATPPPRLAAHAGRSGDLEEIAATIKAEASGYEGLRQWSTIIVSRHLQHLGLPGGTRLNDYLDAVVERGTRYTRPAAFAEMCDFFNVAATGAVN